MKQVKIKLNADKRKVIADQFQSFYEDKVKDKLNLAKEIYDKLRVQAKERIEKVVRDRQPQEDIDTIRAMRNKYNRAGGELYEDNCFWVEKPVIKFDDDGREYHSKDEINVRFDMGRDFARAYYRDEMRAKGLNPDYRLSINGAYHKRNPKYYADETAVERYLGERTSSNDDKSIITPKAKWENDFKLWVVGGSYCHSRQFKVDENDYNFFKTYVQSADEVIKTHEEIYNYVAKKMELINKGLKSYRTFDQAKQLADKVGVVLNETMLNESSSTALSIYNPDNLASMLEDKVEPSKEEKILIAKKLLSEQQASIN